MSQNQNNLMHITMTCFVLLAVGCNCATVWLCCNMICEVMLQTQIPVRGGIVMASCRLRQGHCGAVLQCGTCGVVLRCNQFSEPALCDASCMRQGWLCAAVLRPRFVVICCRFRRAALCDTSCGLQGWHCLAVACPTARLPLTIWIS